MTSWPFFRLRPGAALEKQPQGIPYWALNVRDAAAGVDSGPGGLSHEEVARRLRRFGPNQLELRRRHSLLQVVAQQLRSPLLLLLVFAAVASAASGEWMDAGIVVAIVIATVAVGASREYSAQSAIAALQAQIRTRTKVLRDGQPVAIPVEDVVPGDVVLLSAGAIVPGDALILEASHCFVSEAVLTGESFPVEKSAGVVASSADLRDRTNCVFLGTNVRSGTARCLVMRTGAATEFGSIAGRLMLRPPDTEFDRGIRRFGYLLTTAMLVMVLVVFVAHVFRGRPPVETLLFAIALAVGLSPELLPAILSINLARGARAMARRDVLVRRLNAIENLGSMDVLCTDKTGTLTEGVICLEGAYGPQGEPSPQVMRLAAWNAALQTGLANPLDEAILTALTPDLSPIVKLAETPFDFVRKRVSVVLRLAGDDLLITKGAFRPVLDVCTLAADGRALDDAARADLQARYDAWSRAGTRVLAVATRSLAGAPGGRDDEKALTFAGFLTFLDRPKEGVSATLDDLAALGVSVKLITGDNGLVAQHVAGLVGLRPDRVLTGAALHQMNDEALWHAAEQTDLFVEVDPNQKERIILALKKTGHVVGFLGDGVNDVPAMHAADTSLSVNDAVDVARAAADFVLLQRDLDVIRGGIEEGRKTFANTLKYILTTTSANLGNMVSMAAASLFLPFLPLLAGQILLNNFLSDIPAVGLADDSVDPEMVGRPERWDLRFIARFMIEFGILSSLFDALTFAVLIVVFAATPALFRTGWFVESLMTELVIALVVRTRRPFFRSRPGTLLLWSTLAVSVIAVAIPYLPLAGDLGFVPLPPSMFAVLAAIIAGYVLATEAAKHWFFRARHAGPRRAMRRSP